MSYGIVHGYNYECGGIGDLFRSLVSFHAICKESGIPLYVSFAKIPYFQQCFTCLAPPFHPVETLRHVAGHDGNAFIEAIVRSCEDGKKTVYLECNSGFLHAPSRLLSQLPSFSSLLRPSDDVEAHIRAHGLVAGCYYSVHVRCGDTFMRAECGGRGNVSYDKRTDVNHDRLVYFDRLIQDCATRNGFDRTKPIVLHSDSAEFKHGLRALNPAYVVLETEIQHVANRYGKNTSDSFLSTVAEFYILTRSCGIIMPIYSGFSHMAAFLGQTELFCSATPSEAWHDEMLASFPPRIKTPL